MLHGPCRPGARPGDKWTLSRRRFGGSADADTQNEHHLSAKPAGNQEKDDRDERQPDIVAGAIRRPRAKPAVDEIEDDDREVVVMWTRAVLRGSDGNESRSMKPGTAASRAPTDESR
jgi:hypothetical protein